MKTKATTLSVIMRDSTSVHCYLEVHGESCNVTLRFDRGACAMICGYPQTWDIHDTPVDPYNSESPTGAELHSDGQVYFILQDGRTYISADDELEILRKLKRSIERQFNDCSWMDHELTLNFQLSILNKINRTMAKLGGAR